MLSGYPMERVKARIQKKLAAFSSNEDMESSTLSLAEQKKRSLLKMFDEFQMNESAVSADPVEMRKYNDKFEDLDYLNQARMKVTELTMANDRLKMELLESNKSIMAIKQMLTQERSKIREEQDEIQTKHKRATDELKAEYDSKMEKNLRYIEELLTQKSASNERTEKFILERKKLEKMMAEQKEKMKVEMKAKVEAVEVQERDKRIKWEQNKILELRENTIKGMEPELNAIISNSHNEIKQARQRCEIEKTQYREECYKEFEKKALQFKEEAFRQNEAQKEKLRVEYSSKLKEQYDKLEVQFAQDRQKMRQTYKADIEDVEYKRKNEQEEFMKKNRQTYEEYLTEVKRVRDDYEDRIRILEGSREKYLEAEKEKMVLKFESQAKEEIESYKREQKQKIQTVYSKLHEEYERKTKEELNKIAVMNSELEGDLEIKYENKRKDQKRLFEDEIRKLKRNVLVLEEKLQKHSKTSGEVSKEKDHFETQYMEIKANHDRLYQQLRESQLKVKELERELDTLRLNFSSEITSKVEAEKKTKDKELDNLRRLIEQQEQDKLVMDRNYRNKLNQSEKKWAQQITQFEERARNLVNKKEAEVKQLRGQVKQQEEMAKGYEEVLEKQRKEIVAAFRQ